MQNAKISIFPHLLVIFKTFILFFVVSIIFNKIFLRFLADVSNFHCLRKEYNE